MTTEDFALGNGVLAVYEDGKGRRIEVRDVPWLRGALGKPLVIFDGGEEGTQASTVFPWALEVLFAGLAIKQEDAIEPLKQATEDHLSFGSDLQALFCEALRLKGVNFARAEDLPPEEDPKAGGV